MNMPSFIFENLKELYQDIVLDHSKAPRNFCEIEGCSHHAHGDNPVCGDQLDIYVILDGDRISQISFKGKGCAISTASASLMTELLKGEKLSYALALFRYFHELCTKDEIVSQELFQTIKQEDINLLNVLAGVKQFPLRVKCATLCWHTFKAAVEHIDIVSTEEDY